MQVLIVLAIIAVIFAGMSGYRPDETTYDANGKRTGSVKYDERYAKVVTVILCIPIFAVVFYVATIAVFCLYGVTVSLFR